MPSRLFALDPGGPQRVRLIWKGSWQDFRVILDGQELGSIPSHADLAAGTDFTLPDGSVLNVRVDARDSREPFQLVRNGQPLPDSLSEGRARLRKASLVILLAAGVILVAQLVFGQDLPRPLGTSDEGIELGSLLLVTGLLLLRRALRGLIAALALYALANVLGIALAVAGGSLPSIGGLGVGAVVLYLMARVVGALHAHQRAEDARPRVPYPLPQELAIRGDAPVAVPNAENPYQP